MDIRPFCGVRPLPNLAGQVQGRAYDVMNSEEAHAECAGNPLSILHVTKPEINFEPIIDEHDERVYPEAKKQYERLKTEGVLMRDSKPCYYVYAQTMTGKTQYGLVVTASVKDYEEGRIKKHELTRKAKEDDRKRHIETLQAQIGPAFLVYPHREDLRTIIREVTAGKSTCAFDGQEDGTHHEMWLVDDAETIDQITAIFAEIPALYIADGHHRTAASARCGADYFLAVCFPDDELRILDYNRVVKDTNGLSVEELLARLGEDFEVCELGAEHKPAQLHDFSLYIDHRWYGLRTKEGRYEQTPTGVLDADICSRLILSKHLGITDLRTDKRIDFVGGIRGLEELEHRVDSGEMALAIALYPVVMQQIIDIANAGEIMPPKSTWFEPKLRSGVVINEL